MKLKTFIDKLNTIAKRNPKLLDCDVVYSVDEEGNSFHAIYFDPTPGVYDYKTNDFDGLSIDDEDINSVCVN